MTTFQISPPTTATAHGALRIAERRITWTDLALAAADPAAPPPASPGTG